MDIDARIDEFNLKKTIILLRISNLKTVDRFIYCASSYSLLCKVRNKIGFCHLLNIKYKFKIDIKLMFTKQLFNWLSHNFDNL
ncbi:hypothetical protein BpHYR1_013772 [Brachionus plicatilis]|uniref:Uncharacterized protein n=1 Tax=Brachionus plicatilis TaxID=10195 RepID=A0A3M7RAL2_BRAPC|nr:hypothetical protein BpHYR1_013772 [Brachionus plicatilis]